MFEVSVEATFAAAHFLRNYYGKCENLHGHNYRVQIVLEGEQLDESGMLLDFTMLKRELRAITEQMDHQNLNDLPTFAVTNPSAENIAKHIHDELRTIVPQGSAARITAVKVWEREGQCATYKPSA